MLSVYSLTTANKCRKQKSRSLHSCIS